MLALAPVETFGSVCRQVRLARGLSQVEVAKRGDVFQSRISEIERDAYSPGLELAQGVARGLGIKLSALIAICEGDATVDQVVKNAARGAPIPEVSFEGESVDPQLAAMARKLGYQVLRAVEELLRAGAARHQTGNSIPAEGEEGRVTPASQVVPRWSESEFNNTMLLNISKKIQEQDPAVGIGL